MNAIPILGYMPMPSGFRYRDIYIAGRPRHGKNDPFYHRHPAMKLSQRAKIFSSFDALRGFGDEIASRETIYAERHIPGEDEERELDIKLRHLASLTANGREARKNNVLVALTYFVPSVEGSDRGRYETVEGMCLGIAGGCIRLLVSGRENRYDMKDLANIVIKKSADTA
ncbi:MAG: hypothetical protein IJT56_10230 [Clostridia bacterium]|nr:hypothetical protein [Clostridia bacterium]